jgi:hypothetical protein
MTMDEDKKSLEGQLIVDDEGGGQAEGQNHHQTSIQELLGDTVGLSFDSSYNESDQTNTSSDSSDFQLAEDCDLSRKIMHVIIPNKEKDDNDEYKFTDDDKNLENSSTNLNPVETKKKFCCNNFCNSQKVSVQFRNKLNEIIEKPKAGRKQFLLDHLIKQEELDIPTNGFQFFGFFLCKKAFVQLSGVSDYIVEEACKAFEIGQTVFSHGNETGMRETEGTLGFVIWMKQHAINYGIPSTG